MARRGSCRKGRGVAQTQPPVGGRGLERDMVATAEHAVAIAGGGPTGLMLAAELALAGVDVAIVERRETQMLAGQRAGGVHARSIEVLDQRGVAERFLSAGTTMQGVGFALNRLD